MYAYVFKFDSSNKTSKSKFCMYFFVCAHACPSAGTWVKVVTHGPEEEGNQLLHIHTMTGLCLHCIEIEAHVKG